MIDIGHITVPADGLAPSGSMHQQVQSLLQNYVGFCQTFFGYLASNIQ